MEEVHVKFYRMDVDVQLPTRAHEHDACWDIYSNSGALIQGSEKRIIPTGLKVSIPPGWELQIRPRSGLAARQGISVLNSPGTIDSGYLGEIRIILYKSPHRVNTNHVTQIKKGDRIAQMALKPVYNMRIIEVFEEDLLGETTRGKGGFGSTGN